MKIVLVIFMTLWVRHSFAVQLEKASCEVLIVADLESTQQPSAMKWESTLHNAGGTLEAGKVFLQNNVVVEVKVSSSFDQSYLLDISYNTMADKAPLIQALVLELQESGQHQANFHETINGYDIKGHCRVH